MALFALMVAFFILFSDGHHASPFPLRVSKRRLYAHILWCGAYVARVIICATPFLMAFVGWIRSERGGHYILIIQMLLVGDLNRIVLAAASGFS